MHAATADGAQAPLGCEERSNERRYAGVTRTGLLFTPNSSKMMQPPQGSASKRRFIL